MSVKEEVLTKTSQSPLFAKRNFYLLLLFFFLLPYFLVVGFSLSHLALSAGKNIIVIALLGLFTTIGTTYLLLRGYEKWMQQKVAFLVKQKVDHIGAQSVITYEKEIARLNAFLNDSQRNFEHQIDLLQSSSAKSKERTEELELELEKKQKEIRLAYREYEDLRQEYVRLEEEKSRLKEEDELKIKHVEGLLAEYQQTIQEQRAIIEKKQRYIVKLEEKVRDSMYEIRSLLQLETMERSPIQEFPEQKEELAHYYLPAMQASQTQPHTTYDLALLLQKYIKTAEKFTTLSYKGGKGPRFMDQESYTLDMRRLFESLRDETAGILFVYSLNDGKLIFANPHSKNILGWSPEKLVKDFPQLIVKGHSEWKEACATLPHQKEIELSIVMTHKSGEAIPLQCFLGLISSGPFSGHAVGILA